MIKTILWLSLISFSGVYAEENDRVLHLYGKDFSFKVAEPAGWTLNTRSAPQIANFIFHPVGQDWRRSNTVIFARFIPKEEGDTLEDFLEENQTQFEEGCPFADEEKPQSHNEKVDDFELRSYTCPGFRSELLAVKEVPRFFILFSLSSSESLALEQGLPTLKRILQSFQWFDLPLNNVDPPMIRRPE